MIRLTVLSPHRDDAVFSLYLSLRKWRQSGVRASILNFFTVSNYAPRASENQTAAISFVRKIEDHKVLFGVDKRIRIRDCDLLDAPLRLGIEFAQVCSPEMRAPAASIVPEIAAYIQNQPHKDLLIAPLGLGGHVDHLAVSDAAIAALLQTRRLAFYEDLPYATWTPDDALRRRIHEIQTKVRGALKPVIIRQDYAVRRKLRTAAGYESQITQEEARSIARFSRRYGGGERLWIPRQSKAWAMLTR